MEATLQTENKMGTMSVGRLLANMALPMVASMLVQALYNVVLSAVCCVLFMLFGVFGTGLFFRVQTDIPEIYNGGVQYLQICTLFSFGLFGEILFERLLQATGRTMYTMITQGIGAVLNIILDPLFIFGGLGIPAMGVAGAAVATVIGQIVAFFLALLFHLRKNPEVTLSRQSMRLHWDVLKPILSVGIPSIVMVAIGSVMNFTMNQILVGFTSTAVAVFGAYFKLQSFIFMPVFGLTNAMVPIVAYNFGARKPARIQKCIVLSCICAFLFMLCGFAVFQITPELLLAMFHPTDTFLSMGSQALRIISWGFPIASFCVVLSAVFQALGIGLYATIVSLARQLLVLLPVAYLLSLSNRLELVWWSFPVAELVCIIVTLFFFYRVYRQKLRPISEASVSGTPGRP